MQRGSVRKLMAVGGCAGIAAVVAACGGSSNNSPSASSGGGAGIPSGLSVNSFDVNFSVMSQFKGLVSSGKGLVGVVLPDTTSSTRYVQFDQPYLTTAFQKAGYTDKQFKIDNAQGSDATELADVQSDITLGASVIVFDPLDSTVGTQIQQYASQHGVSTISYDRATFSGSNTYYVSFDNVQVGKLIGQGFEDCVSSWNVSSPKVFTLNGGEDTDPNAISFAQGYNQVVWGSTDTPQKAGATNSKGYTLVGDQITPGWVNATGGTIFQQQYTAHPNINATIEANDGLANAVITVLKNTGAKPKTIPTTGQDATPQGMENVLAGYQCGSVYKAVYKEAGAAVALATILRAGQTPPSSLVNGTTSPPSGVSGNQQPAVLLTPTWVTTSNMESTVIKDGFVKADTICSVVGASVCSQAGIS